LVFNASIDLAEWGVILACMTYQGIQESSAIFNQPCTQIPLSYFISDHFCFRILIRHGLRLYVKNPCNEMSPFCICGSQIMSEVRCIE